MLEKSFTSCDYRPIEEFLYKEDGKLYYYVNEIDDFLLLHDFSAEVGDTIRIPSYPKQEQFTGIDTFFVRIDSITEIAFDTLNLKQFHFTRGFREENGNIYFGINFLPVESILIEDFGSINSFFNFTETGFCDEGYSQPLLSIYLPDLGEFDIYTTLVHVTDDDNSDLIVYPNPFTNYLSIDQIPNNASSISIVDNLGQQVITKNVNSDIKTTTIDMSSYSQGIYFLLLRDEKQIILKSVKIVKSH